MSIPHRASSQASPRSRHARRASRYIGSASAARPSSAAIPARMVVRSASIAAPVDTRCLECREVVARPGGITHPQRRPGGEANAMGMYSATSSPVRCAASRASPSRPDANASVVRAIQSADRNCGSTLSPAIDAISAIRSTIGSPCKARTLTEDASRMIETIGPIEILGERSSRSPRAPTPSRPSGPRSRRHSRD